MLNPALRVVNKVESHENTHEHEPRVLMAEGGRGSGGHFVMISGQKRLSLERSQFVHLEL